MLVFIEVKGLRISQQEWTEGPASARRHVFPFKPALLRMGYFQLFQNLNNSATLKYISYIYTSIRFCCNLALPWL